MIDQQQIIVIGSPTSSIESEPTTKDISIQLLSPVYITNTSTQTTPKIKKSIAKPKKYIQDQTYKGIFQRLCVLCQEKPKNKNFKFHLILKINEAINNQGSTENKIVLEIAKKYKTKDNNLFIDHLLNMLKNCQNQINIESPSVIRAIKKVHQSIAIQQSIMNACKIESQ